MSGIVIDHSKCIQCLSCVSSCPFKALFVNDKGQIEVNSACKSCKGCISSCPVSAISYKEDVKETIDKSLYKDILVYVEHTKGEIHPVTIELIGKALELVKVTNQKVNCLFIGFNIKEKAKSLLDYGVNEVYVYDDEQLEYFRSDVYTNIFEDVIKTYKPSSCLVGATSNGRCLAPRVACRFKTGLTADTTILQMRENTDLVQIRPAFGGNIMAQILTTNNRPQFATVRYQVFDPAKKTNPIGKIINRKVKKEFLNSKITINEIHHKEKSDDISNSDVLVVVGQGVKDEKGLQLCQQLAELLNGQLAFSRPMVEKGLADVSKQIGLSGRTVKPSLIITCGVSGAIQFVSGMQNSKCIVAINSDPNCNIFKIAHYSLVGDLYEILPKLIKHIKEGE